MAAKPENLNSSSILRLYKQHMMLKLMDIKSKEPRLTQKQISKQLDYSDKLFKRYRDDINMDSPYIRRKYKKKNNKLDSSKTQTQSNTKSGEIKKNKNNKKNDLKSGSLLDNNQDYNTKFFTLV